MNEQQQLLVDMVGWLKATSIPYMLTGSYGSALHGEPRSTNDIDIVIDPTNDQLRALFVLLGAQGDRYYQSWDAAEAALQRRSMFNVIDTSTGWKVDLIVRKAMPFSIAEFERRRTVAFAGEQIDAVSPEDAILSKLEWSRKGESERQLRDAESVAVVKWQQLDREYLHHWAAELGVSRELDLVLQRAAHVYDGPAIEPTAE